MKKSILLLVTLALVCGITSCTTTSGSSASQGAPAGEALVLNKPLAAAHQSALHALATIGADVKVNKPNYVEGRRPNKIGLVVGSGGETIEISLTAQGAKTSVTVNTKKSIVGIAGQKNWDSHVRAAMQE